MTHPPFDCTDLQIPEPDLPRYQIRLNQFSIHSAPTGLAGWFGKKDMRNLSSDSFHALRVEEIDLTADYLVKKEEEREVARAERERLREERKVEQELAAARERLEKEHAHLVTVMEKLKETGVSAQDLEDRLANVNAAIAQNDYRGEHPCRICLCDLGSGGLR